MSYQFGQQIPLDNTGAKSSLLDSLMGFGQSSAPVGSGMALPAVPGVTGDAATLGGGGFGMTPLAGQFGQPGMDAGSVLAGVNTSGYTPLTNQFAPDASGGDWFSKMMGGKDGQGNTTNGILPVGLGAIQGLGSLFMGMQQYGLAKKQLAEGKRRYDQDYNAQKTLTNARMEDRQKARVADGRPGAYESVGSYMNKNGIK